MKTKLHKEDILLPTQTKEAAVYELAYDLFEEDFEFIDRVLAVIAICPQHTFWVLTKRAERMRDYSKTSFLISKIERQSEDVGKKINMSFPLHNLWLGVSIKDQATANARIPCLPSFLSTCKFLVVEPLSEAINFKQKNCFSFGNGKEIGVDVDYLTGKHSYWHVGFSKKPSFALWAKAVSHLKSNIPFCKIHKVFAQKECALSRQIEEQCIESGVDFEWHCQ
jgi:hypothetical protein